MNFADPSIMTLFKYCASRSVFVTYVPRSCALTQSRQYHSRSEHSSVVPAEAPQLSRQKLGGSAVHPHIFGQNDTPWGMWRTSLLCRRTPNIFDIRHHASPHKDRRRVRSFVRQSCSYLGFASGRALLIFSLLAPWNLFAHSAFRSLAALAFERPSLPPVLSLRLHLMRLLQKLGRSRVSVRFYMIAQAEV